MGPSARAVAEQASLQAFLHCYLREVDAGRWRTRNDEATGAIEAGRAEALCELELAAQETRLAIEVLYRSRAGRHRFGRIWFCSGVQQDWNRLEPWQAMSLLVRELYARPTGMVPELRKARELELFYRLADSYRVMTRYVAARRHDPRLDSDRFIDSEQALLFGHAAHPTPKSRQGLAEWQHDTYAPELTGRFQLACFAVHRDLVEQGSCLDIDAEAMVSDALGGGEGAPNLPADRVLVPAHPLQAQWLLSQPAVIEAIAKGRIQPLGSLGPLFTATSSVRTLYSEKAEWMFKFSIPVKVTNSLRINKSHELRAGMVMARLIERTGFLDAEPHFRFLQDPAFLTVRLDGLRESGFEVILRENPFAPGRDRGVISLATLTQDPLEGRTSRLHGLIEGLALNEGRSLAAVSRDWFRHYLHCAIKPALRLYDDHGIALEAHLQNSLLDLGAGYPARFYYRDNQGFYLSQARRAELESLCPEVAESPELFYRDEMIRDRFCYYLVANQLFSVIARFGQDGLLEESSLLTLLRQALMRWRERMQGPAGPLLDMLLQTASLPYKGNLLTRVHDVDELDAELEMAVYTRIPNPLLPVPVGAHGTHREEREPRHDVA
ncbi:IucA/IucC family protein [Billgrantia sp. LNSP4103-1]|uniref:IucA/IucC family protein n=1 Tax=Billgrantia sp. LNSP4103-1 TaxID=3410266 RepID=UPI00403F5FD0